MMVGGGNVLNNLGERFVRATQTEDQKLNSIDTHKNGR